MKIRNPWLIKVLGLVVAVMIRMWIGTLRFRYRPVDGRDRHPHRVPPEERYIYAFWHETILLPAFHYGRPDCYALISQHADGQLIAEACRHLGFRTVRGSTRRGGIEATRELLRVGKKGNHVGVTPDGPRGPRRQVQPGIIYLASRTGLPIIPVGVGFRRPWRMRSWDRFALPRPWSDAALVTGEPISVPPDLDREAIERYRQLLEQALHEVTATAECWAEHGRGQAPLVAAASPTGSRPDLWALLHRQHANGNGRAAGEHGPRAA